jgi:hypothetical protein
MSSHWEFTSGFLHKKWKPWPVEVDDLPLEHEKTGRFSKENC